MVKNIFSDARHYQLLSLSALLAAGVASGSFDIEPAQIAAIGFAALLTQYLGNLMTATRFEPRGALIMALLLALFLRADGPAPLMTAAAIGVGAKFVLRFDAKPIFNPAAAGVVSILLLSQTLTPGAAWTTPGQWGTALWLAAALAGAGLLVFPRAARIDALLIFLGAFATLVVARAFWAGDPLTIPLMTLQNGALMVFAFFILADPKPAPEGTIARAAFSAAAAVFAYILIYRFHVPDGGFYALAGVCIARPILDRIDPAPHYRWGEPLFRRRYLALSSRGETPSPSATR